MPAMIDVTCKCGKVFQARKADRDRGWGKSCSKSCAKKNNSPSVTPAPETKRGNEFCRDCGDDRSIGQDGLCDHCAYMNEPLMGWDEHK